MTPGCVLTAAVAPRTAIAPHWLTCENRLGNQRSLVQPSHVIIGASAAVVVIGGFIFLNMSQKADADRRQRETDAKLAAIQQRADKQIEDAQAKAVQPGTAGATSQNAGATSALAREKATHDVLTEGFRLLDTRDPQKAQDAAKIFQEGIDNVDSQNTDFYHGLGRALLLTKHYQEARAAFEKGLALKPKNAELASGLGWAFWDMQDYYHAKEAWERAIANDSTNLDAWSVMAWVYLGLEDQKKAIRGFDVLLASRGGKDRTDWNNGMTMARSPNFQLNQIRSQFPLPDPKLFLTPPTTSSAPAAR